MTEPRRTSSDAERPTPEPGSGRMADRPGEARPDDDAAAAIRAGLARQCPESSETSVTTHPGSLSGGTSAGSARPPDPDLGTDALVRERLRMHEERQRADAAVARAEAAEARVAELESERAYHLAAFDAAAETIQAQVDDD